MRLDRRCLFCRLFVSPEDAYGGGDVLCVDDGHLALHGEEQHEAGRRRPAANLGESDSDWRMEVISVISNLIQVISD